LAGISDDELRNKTKEVSNTINDALKGIDDQIAAQHAEIDENPDMDVHQKEERFNKIDKLEEDRNDELEKVLMQVLPDAFAIVKETARRFKKNKKGTVNCLVSIRSTIKNDLPSAFFITSTYGFVPGTY
jgi:preprotein translocase subunit SecA